jgi:hypothetical protein
MNLARIGLGLAVIGAALMNHATASATEPHGVNFSIRTALDPNLCVETTPTGGPEGRTVYIATCAARNSQRWTFTWNGDNNSVIVGDQGVCLDIRGRKAKDGKPVQVFKCHFGDNQRFTMTADGHIREIKTQKCLEIAKAAANAVVQIDDCDPAKKEQIFGLSQ